MNESGNWKQCQSLHVCAQEKLMLAGASERQFSGGFVGTGFHNFFLCFTSKVGGGSHLTAGEV